MIAVSGKEQLREDLRQRRRALPPAERAAKSDAIRERLTELSLLADADTIFLYLAVDNEVDTRPLLDALLETEKRIAVPAVDGDSMIAARLQDTDALERGPFDVPQPWDPAEKEVAPDDIDVSIVPGIAFDDAGNRIGRGEGYYDRFLARTDDTAVGLAYAFQLVERIDTDPWDVPVDRIVTEERVITCR